MAKYGPKTQEEVKEMMREHKYEGKFSSSKQAIAVGLSKARREGAKVPNKPAAK